MRLGVRTAFWLFFYLPGGFAGVDVKGGVLGFRFASPNFSGPDGKIFEVGKREGGRVFPPREFFYKKV